MKVREERVLTDRKLAKSGGQVDELLAACWEKTLDAGPYVVPEGAKLDLGKVLQGDRFFALLMVRALTYGPEYAIGVSCRNDNCRARIEWEIDLTKLSVRKLVRGDSFVKFSPTICGKSRDRFSARFMPMPLPSMESRATASVASSRRSSASCSAKGVPSKLRSMRAVKRSSISSNTTSSERSRVRPMSKPATMCPSGARTLVGSS